MDTHIASSPDLEPEGASFSARLPGEPDPGVHPPVDSPTPETDTASSLATPRNKNRRVLLAGVAIAGVGLAAGGAFVFSPYNHIVPVPAKLAATVQQLEQQARIRSEKLLAPSASLANVSLPERPSSVIVPKYEPKPREQESRRAPGDAPR